MLGLALRAFNLGWPPLWADEAESTLNALSIVASGLPRDGYMGQPIYENVLVRRWPGNPEYAYRDLSYSERGLAIYHGWLPLYATALAFRLAGVTPEAARRGPPVSDGSTAEMVRWTVVPRLPALAFSALLVLAAFALGRRTGGSGTGWAMAIATAGGGIFVWLGRQARYYSPALALSAVCGLAVWNACRRGRWRDHLLAGVALALLFHTQALSAVATALLYAAAVPLATDRRRAVLGVGLAGAIAAALTLPWAWWAGLFGTLPRLPPAWRFLDRALVLRSLPSSNPVVLATALAGVAAVLVLLARRTAAAERWRWPLRELGPALAFAAAWTVLAWASFVLLIPAPSYFVVRLKLAVAVPGLLLIALLLTAFLRGLRREGSGLLVPLAMVGLLVLARQLPPPLQHRDAPLDEYEVAALVRSWPLAPGYRVYAMPANQLALTYYSGRPVQSVSAVRRSWLDGFAGDLVILESRRYEPLPVAQVRALALGHGRRLSAEDAAALARQAVVEATVEDLSREGIRVLPAVAAAADPLALELVAPTRRFTAGFIRDALAGTPLGRVRAFANWSEFWQFFFFWFDDPARHTGDALNFRARAQRAETHVLASGWVVYDCRPRHQPPLVGPPSRFVYSLVAQLPHPGADN